MAWCTFYELIGGNVKTVFGELKHFGKQQKVHPKNLRSSRKQSVHAALRDKWTGAVGCFTGRRKEKRIHTEFLLRLKQ